MFIVIDGPDGAGKTTLTHNIIKILNRQYHLKAYYTCEPTHSKLGQRIRLILKNPTHNRRELLELFLADREQHVLTEIIPHSKNGWLVISDRYKYSTVCYQSLQGFNLPWLIKRNVHFLAPDLSLILLLPPQIAWKRLTRRLKKKKESADIFEALDLMKKTHRLFLKMHKYFPTEKIIYINANQKPGKLTKIAIRYILKFIRQQPVVFP